MWDEEIFFRRVGGNNLRGVAPLRDIAVKYDYSFGWLDRLRYSDPAFPEPKYKLGKTLLYDEVEVGMFLKGFTF